MFPSTKFARLARMFFHVVNICFLRSLVAVIHSENRHPRDSFHNNQVQKYLSPKRVLLYFFRLVGWQKRFLTDFKLTLKKRFFSVCNENNKQRTKIPLIFVTGVQKGITTENSPTLTIQSQTFKIRKQQSRMVKCDEALKCI